MNPKCDFFFNKPGKWQDTFEQLRMLILDCGLNEELKWGVPCYTFNKKNVLLIHGFKEYCAMLFLKGSLLNDEKGILVQQTQNVQAARQIRFTDVKQVMKMQPALKAYIYEAIEIEKAGLKVELKKTSELNMPEEFKTRLKEDPKLKKAFYGLSPE